ncbi:MAG: LPXTG cell wall anchor domain-containing protein [Chloroflexi bacterium]|nr:LPXTG cell wall anchor domain-containing protein [Chloroflexota bacterium]MDA1173588.1 LPXTG cell wall anchor domain-containing protein [Chloroflexota bacterium]
MLERQELAGVVFGLGAVIEIVGIIGLGTGDALNYAVMGAGIALMIVGAAWWTLLKRRGL